MQDLYRAVENGRAMIRLESRPGMPPEWDREVRDRQPRRRRDPCGSGTGGLGIPDSDALPARARNP
jgi:hypothetical protein